MLDPRQMGVTEAVAMAEPARRRQPEPAATAWAAIYSVLRRQPAAARMIAAMPPSRCPPRPMPIAEFRLRTRPRSRWIFLVLDRSASMSYSIASDTSCSGGAAATCTGRWSSITTALNQVLGNSPGVQWGLKFFPSPGGGELHGNVRSRCWGGPDTAAQIQPAITGTGPGAQEPRLPQPPPSRRLSPISAR